MTITTIQQITEYVSQEQPEFLTEEVGATYICWSINQFGKVYGTGLINALEELEARFHLKLSDTNMYEGLKFLESQGIITGSWEKVAGRGRPRRIYTVAQPSQLADLANLWEKFLFTKHKQGLAAALQEWYAINFPTKEAV